MGFLTKVHLKTSVATALEAGHGGINLVPVPRIEPGHRKLGGRMAIILRKICENIPVPGREPGTSA